MWVENSVFVEKRKTYTPWTKVICLKSVCHGYHCRTKSELFRPISKGRSVLRTTQTAADERLRAESSFKVFRVSYVSVLGVSRLDRESWPFSRIVSGLGLSVTLCGLAERRRIVVDFRIFNSNYSPSDPAVTMPRYRVIGLTLYLISTYCCFKNDQPFLQHF